MKNCTTFNRSYLKATFTCLLLAMLLSVNAQVNRRNTKSVAGFIGNYQRMSAGGFHTLEIRAGELWTWGSNQFGQLGDGTTINENSPIRIGTDTNWLCISGGYNHSFGLKSDGTLWAWGDNQNGQLGDGSYINKNIPVQIGTQHDWIAIAAGYTSNLALKSDGTLWAWGANQYGQLGDGTNAAKNSPVQVGIENKWTSISIGDNQCHGLKSDGTHWAWGYNDFGQLGDGTLTSRNSPIQIGTDNNWVTLSAGSNHCLGIKSNGTLWAWGYNGSGEIGDGTNNNSSTPVQIGTENSYKSISAGYANSHALKSNGTLWAWGDNSSGELGNGSTSNSLIPIQIGNDKKWKGISSGHLHNLGLKSDGTLWVWGYNANGQLGDGTILDKNSPIQITVDATWLSISAGNKYNLGIKSDGTLWAWGWNGFYQLGDTTYTDKYSPSQIGTDNKWVAISAGRVHCLALKSDGTLWAWGNNMYGQIGNGTQINQITPSQIGTNTNWMRIFASGSGDNSFAIKSDGTLWAWGKGILGNGSVSAFINSPVQIGIDTKWVSVSASGLHTIGLKSDGTLWAWGNNNRGELGNGSFTSELTPVQIGTDNNWIEVRAGDSYSFGLKSDGTLWAWGFNTDGELGDGSTNDKNSPVQIGNDNNWLAIFSNVNHSAALKSDGSLWAWGVNATGQLGDGTTNNKISPVHIGNETYGITLSEGTDHSLALKPSGMQVCASGNNDFGQLGICNLSAPALNYVCNDLPIGIYASSGNVINCPGGFVSFSVSANAVTTYQWQENNNGTWFNLNDLGVYSGTASPTLTISSVSINFNSRMYRCILKGATTCPPADTTKSALLLVIAPIATVSTPNGLTSFCVGDKFVLRANKDSSATYKWYKSGNLLAGRISDTLSITVGGTYSVEVTFSTNCSAISSAVNISSIVKPPAHITANGNTTFCKGAFVTLNGNVGAGFSRQWQLNGVDIPNAIFVNYAADSSGFYTLKVTNSQGCDSISNNIQVTVYPFPIATITYSGNPYTCAGNSVMLTASQGIGYTYQWLLNGNTITGATDSTYAATGTITNNYKVIVKNAGNCATTSAATILNPVPLAPSICLVTVDSTSTNNLIYWEKNPGDTTIDSYYMYRDTSNNNFALIGIVPHDSLSLFVDTLRHLYAANGNPTASSWRYKIAVKDICGALSAPSLFHQTIFFQDIGNGNFSWSEYRIEGQALPVNQLNNYKIFRDSISDGNWKLIQTLSASSTTYIDVNYSLFPIGRWKVEGVWNTSCNPTARIATGVNNTRSNIKNKINPNAVFDNKRFDKEIKLQPNPATDIVQISSGIELESIRVFDYLGREVLYQKLESARTKKVELSVSTLASGVYTVVCKGKDYEVRKKLVVE